MNSLELTVCRIAAWWCDHWVTHTCGPFRFWCHMPSQPWFVRWADRISERYEERSATHPPGEMAVTNGDTERNPHWPDK